MEIDLRTLLTNLNIGDTLTNEKHICEDSRKNTLYFLTLLF